MLRTSEKAIRAELGLDPKEPLWDFNGRFLPYSTAPVVVAREEQHILKPMNFSLVPHWSKTPKVKFATYNARLDTILQKPTWRGPFVKKHCLVPISEFVESITEIGKKYSGNMVRFHDKENQIMVAAGIYDEWTNSETGEILESFAILTDEPSPFIAKIGHDRSPVFLDKDHYHEWLTFKGDGQAALALLRRAKKEFDYQVEIERPLKPGWEKRK